MLLVMSPLPFWRGLFVSGNMYAAGIFIERFNKQQKGKKHEQIDDTSRLHLRIGFGRPS